MCGSQVFWEFDGEPGLRAFFIDCAPSLSFIYKLYNWTVYLDCGDPQPLVHTGGFTDLVFHAWWTVEWRSFADKKVPKPLILNSES